MESHGASHLPREWGLGLGSLKEKPPGERLTASSQLNRSRLT